RPVSFNFVQAPNWPGDWRQILEDLEAAKAEGLQIRGQVIPRPVGILLGLELSLHPFSLNPSFRAIEHLPLDEKVKRMRDAKFRKRLLAERPEDPHAFFVAIVSDLEMLFVLGDPPNYHPRMEESIASRARAMGVDPRELIYDALLARDGHEILYRPMGNCEGE